MTFPLLSLRLGGGVKINKWLIYRGDGWLYKWQSTLGAKGHTAASQKRVVVFRWLLMASSLGSSLSGVRTFPYTSVLRILAYKKQRANVAVPQFKISYHRKSIYRISEVEQLIEKGAVPNVPRAMDPVIWIQQLDCLSATARICAWIAATIGCFSV